MILCDSDNHHGLGNQGYIIITIERIVLQTVIDLCYNIIL